MWYNLKNEVADMNILFFLTRKKDSAYLYEDDTLRQTIEKMAFHRYSVLPIITKEGEFIGTVSEGDILYHLREQGNFSLEDAEHILLKDIARYREYNAIRIDSEIEDLIILSLDQNFIPIVDDRNIYMGMVKRRAIIEYFYKKTRV